MCLCTVNNIPKLNKREAETGIIKGYVVVRKYPRPIGGPLYGPVFIAPGKPSAQLVPEGVELSAITRSGFPLSNLPKYWRTNPQGFHIWSTFQTAMRALSDRKAYFRNKGLAEGVSLALVEVSGREVIATGKDYPYKYLKNTAGCNSACCCVVVRYRTIVRELMEVHPLAAA